MPHKVTAPEVLVHTYREPPEAHTFLRTGSMLQDTERLLQHKATQKDPAIKMKSHANRLRQTRPICKNWHVTLLIQCVILKNLEVHSVGHWAQAGLHVCEMHIPHLHHGAPAQSIQGL